MMGQLLIIPQGFLIRAQEGQNSQQSVNRGRQEQRGKHKLKGLLGPESTWLT